MFTNLGKQLLLEMLQYLPVSIVGTQDMLSIINKINFKITVDKPRQGPVRYNIVGCYTTTLNLGQTNKQEQQSGNDGNLLHGSFCFVCFF
jgi:hypothetical protein